MSLWIDFPFRRFRMACLFALLPFWTSPCRAQVGPDSERQSEYAALLARVQQGDMSVDFRTFRISASLSVGRHSARQEFADDGAARQLLAVGDFPGALDAASRTLEHNYTSLFGHLNALVASQKLNKIEEASVHERLLKALTDSILKSGDGKSMDTAWFVVSVAEEYFLLRQVLRVRQSKQSLVTKNGHAYDDIDVVDPQTQESRSLWFNTDVDMGVFKSPTQPPSVSYAAQLVTNQGFPAVTAEIPSRANVNHTNLSQDNFSLVEQPKGMWDVIWDLQGTYEIASDDVVVTIQGGAAALDTARTAGKRPVQLRALQLGICSARRPSNQI
jgi:hypothetical protein